VHYPKVDRIQAYPARTWCALHTKARHEKKVAGICERLQIPVYLPLYLHRTFSGGKVNNFYLPMFSGYVFAAVGAGDMLPLKRTNSVAKKIEPLDEGSLVQDLNNILTIETGQVEIAMATSLKGGQKVIITSGPLAGISGVVLRYKNHTRLQVAIETIQQAIVVDVSKEALAPLNE
jgi:transcriptional antiterminator RfaH